MARDPNDTIGNCPLEKLEIGYGEEERSGEGGGEGEEETSERSCSGT